MDYDRKGRDRVKNYMKYILLLAIIVLVTLFINMNSKVIIPDKIIIEDRGEYENSRGNLIEITEAKDVRTIAKIIDKLKVVSSNTYISSSKSDTMRNVYVEYSNYDIEYLISYKKNNSDNSRVMIHSMPEGFRYYLKNDDANELAEILEAYLD